MTKLKNSRYQSASPFTKRELEILKLISKENSSTSIAEKLFISINTVETHRRNMIKKAEAKNFYGVMMYAFKNKLIK